MKVPAKDRGGENNNGKNDSAGSVPTLRTSVRVVRSDQNNKDLSQPSSNNKSNGTGYLNLRQRPASPSQRILR